MKVDFRLRFHSLVDESFSFKKYKALGSKVWAIVAFISVLPVFLVYCLLIALYALNLFFYSLVSSPVDYLDGLMKERGDGLTGAGQFVVYLVSWPLVFMLHVFMSLFSAFFYVQYFLLMVVGFVWTFGGITFYPSIATAGEPSKEPVTINKIFAMVVSVANIVIFITCMVLLLVGIALSDDTSGTYILTMGDYWFWYLCNFDIVVYFLFADLFSLFFVTKKPLAK
jgi:hypothetical protein